ncbi:hypothetical protein [Flagellimonas crocea]|uniref:hypothetical protein n=1 Tax=Flagellimonas crocea TaxID=3067311 RepID=UPI00296FFA15|nr:hypothetical protein [Muricauda sp. DH64]
MKVWSLLRIFFAVVLLSACGNSEKKDKTDSESSGMEIKIKKGDDIDLDQKGDYTQLYTVSEDCKLTNEQLAEALGYTVDQVEEQSNYQGNCWYKVTHPDGITVNYGIRLEKWGDLGIVSDEIKSGLKNELIEMRISSSGDTYLKRHPAQGFLLLLNTNYANPIQISYSYLNTDGPKLTEAQKEERKANTYTIANYLIEHYQK